MSQAWLTPCIFSAWIASQLSQVYNHTNLYLNIWIFKNYPQRIVSCNVNLSNLENVLQRNHRTKRGRSAILEKSTAQCQPYGGFVGSVYLPACQKKLWICHWQASEKVNWIKKWLYSWFYKDTLSYFCEKKKMRKGKKFQQLAFIPSTQYKVNIFSLVMKGGTRTKCILQFVFLNLYMYLIMIFFVVWWWDSSEKTGCGISNYKIMSK